jgi:hypothetical protein
MNANASGSRARSGHDGAVGEDSFIAKTGRPARHRGMS